MRTRLNRISSSVFRPSRLRAGRRRRGGSSYLAHVLVASYPPASRNKPSQDAQDRSPSTRREASPVVRVDGARDTRSPALQRERRRKELEFSWQWPIHEAGQSQLS